MTKNKNNKSITNPHDAFFRTAMSDKRVSKDFLTHWLPQDLCETIDFNHLQIQPRSQINDLRKESEVDVLFKTQINQRDAYVYVLVEHQSTPDELMPLRLMKYMLNIIDAHLKDHKTKKIPFIYPIVLYHGKRKYPFSTNINDLVDAPNELVERYFLKPFQLIDLGKVDDDTLKQHQWAGVMQFALKHIYDRDILLYFRDMAKILHQICLSNGHDYTAVVLQYILERGELSNKEAFFHIIDTEISHDIGEKIMSLAEQLREEGELRGRLEGELRGRLEGELRGALNKEIEIAKRMLDEGVEVVFIAKITGLSLDKVKSLKNIK